MPIEDALALADQRLREESRDALRHAQSCWHSALGLYAMGGEPPPCPTLDDE